MVRRATLAEAQLAFPYMHDDTLNTGIQKGWITVEGKAVVVGDHIGDLFDLDDDHWVEELQNGA